jgi:hypothetical protein
MLLVLPSQRVCPYLKNYTLQTVQSTVQNTVFSDHIGELLYIAFIW